LKPAPKPTGLRYWMLRVLEECESVAADFSADAVHDLRVSLRRCRSLADGMMAIDPHSDWKDMKKAGRQLFRRLGALRDIQIMMEWIDKLSVASPGPSSEPASSATAIESFSDRPPTAGSSNQPEEKNHDPARQLLAILRQREAEQKREARAALEEFDRKQWRQWSNILPARASHIRPGSAVFKHLALERWMAARQLHTRALRNRSQVAFHTLRIGIKRFRYIVENFLPLEHQAWSDELKRLQDLLGEVHDLDVLWETALSSHIFPDDASRQHWRDHILRARAPRLEEYRSKTVGPHSLWEFWRAGLPQGEQIQEIATQRLKLWAKALDPDFAHSERVARLALELYDGLVANRLLAPGSFPPSSENGRSGDARQSLQVAALLHDVGKAKGEKGHHKKSSDLIKKHGAPLGWKPENILRAAIVARFHAGALPVRNHRELRDLLSDEQKIIIQLAAILRLANAFDAAHDGQVRKVRIENLATRPPRRSSANGFARKIPGLAKDQALVIEAEGYLDGTSTAQTVAAERYLLETVLRRPIVVRPSKTTSAS
jgi:CHAD domain-containing protein/HD superfamily phosphodiesterase